MLQRNVKSVIHFLCGDDCELPLVLQQLILEFAGQLFLGKRNLIWYTFYPIKRVRVPRPFMSY